MSWIRIIKIVVAKVMNKIFWMPLRVITTADKLEPKAFPRKMHELFRLRTNLDLFSVTCAIPVFRWIPVNHAHSTMSVVKINVPHFNGWKAIISKTIANCNTAPISIDLAYPILSKTMPPIQFPMKLAIPNTTRIMLIADSKEGNSSIR